METPLAWYPAPGYRNLADGVQHNVGKDGYSWSSAVSGTYGVFLDFGTQSLHPGNVVSHGHGFLLRCLSEVRVALPIGSLCPNKQPLLQFTDTALAMRKHRSVAHRRFIRVLSALLAGRRPRRAVPSGSKLESRPPA
ncbi:hypothetical protein [uncultured Rikenella sp.]|uniref:hypothetical protein n=1 Tax=uncultured Rikenella sp. TaxID=368003 RepID=UPI0025D55A2F|nr:hypothetical protein [uncultured Rikenella sp.]